MSKCHCVLWVFSKGSLYSTKGIRPFLEFAGKVFVMTVFFEEAREEGLRSCVMSDLEAGGPSLASSHSS